MFGLILETSTEKGCAVCSKKNFAIDFQTLPEGAALSKTLALEVEQMILRQKSGIPDFIAVGTGPGSYTGIRVGAALAKALSFGWNIPLFGFCSLKAYFPKRNPENCTIVLDARGGGFYILESPESLPVRVPLLEAQQILLKAAQVASPHPQRIQKRIESEAPYIETSPDPDLLASIGYALACRGDPAPPLELNYLVEPGAY